MPSYWSSLQYFWELSFLCLFHWKITFCFLIETRNKYLRALLKQRIVPQTHSACHCQLILGAAPQRSELFTEKRFRSLRRDTEGQILLVCTILTKPYCTSALWCSIYAYSNYPTYLNNKKTFQANEHIAHLKLRHNARLWGLFLSVTINDIFMYATPLAEVLMLCPPIH